MRHMVRVLVGTMLGGVRPDDFRRLLEGGRAARRGRPRRPKAFTWSP